MTAIESLTEEARQMLRDMFKRSNDNGTAVIFSQDDSYISIVRNTSPYISIYEREGDTYCRRTDECRLDPPKLQIPPC